MNIALKLWLRGSGLAIIAVILTLVSCVARELTARRGWEAES